MTLTTLSAFGRSCHISLTGAGECHPIHQDGTYDLGHVVNLPNNNKGIIYNTTKPLNALLTCA
jgi:hypothetical protein